MNRQAITAWMPGPKGHILPIGDVHIGDKAFGDRGEKKLRGNIKFIKYNDPILSMLMGDIFNVATRTSKTNPLKSRDLDAEIDMAIEYFMPIKDKLLGAIDGNHEQRLEDFCGMSPTKVLCRALDIPYLGYSAVYKIGVGVGRYKIKGKLVEKARKTYIIYTHHGFGGGITIGAKLNAVQRLRSILVNADLYLMGHNHGLVHGSERPYECDRRSGLSSELRQSFVACGSYLSWNKSYAEKKGFPPQQLGSPRIRLDGLERDVKVSE